MTEPRPEVKAVLWDADGVLQHGRQGDWHAYFTEIGGPGFAEALFAAETGPLRGEEPLRDAIARMLPKWDTALSVDEVLALWEQIDVDAQAFDLIARVRRAGVQCHLATNQQDHRVRYMRESLGYDQHFDRTYYSSEMGAMKPEATFFEYILNDLGLEPERVVFIDDVAANVFSATELGIRAHRHDPTDGAAGLRRILSVARGGLLTPRRVRVR